MSDTPETDDIARGNHVVPTEWAQQLERERDEAREALEFRRELYKVQEKCLEDARRERDDARDALMRIEDLFIDGTDIYADREKMGMIARSALEETK